jgi:hypothetical protein
MRRNFGWGNSGESSGRVGDEGASKEQGVNGVVSIIGINMTSNR